MAGVNLFPCATKSGSSFRYSCSCGGRPSLSRSKAQGKHEAGADHGRGIYDGAMRWMLVLGIAAQRLFLHPTKWRKH